MKRPKIKVEAYTVKKINLTLLFLMLISILRLLFEAYPIPVWTIYRSYSSLCDFFVKDKINLILAEFFEKNKLKII